MDTTFLQFSLIEGCSSIGEQIIFMITCIVAMHEPPIPIYWSYPKVA